MSRAAVAGSVSSAGISRPNQSRRKCQLGYMQLGSAGFAAGYGFGLSHYLAGAADTLTITAEKPVMTVQTVTMTPAFVHSHRLDICEQGILLSTISS